MRAALEKLTEELIENKKQESLNKSIQTLKEKGFPDQGIKCCDIIRIMVHEGSAHADQIDLTGVDSPEIVSELFMLVNYIVEDFITREKRIEKMYNALPQDKKQGIKNRDKS